MDLHIDHPVMVVIQSMPRSPPPPPSSSSSDTSFPILAISILGIFTTAILLLSYYVFVIKCCLDWHRHDVTRRLSRAQSRLRRNPNHSLLSSTYVHQGLEESVIQAIPTLRFKRGSEKQCSFHECAVCLNEFQGEERIRMLPNCFHVFHIDCIDTWLQTHANCPLCRADITSTTPILDEGSSRSVTIDVRDERTSSASVNNPPAANDTNSSVGRKERKLQKMSSMGDECIDVRGNSKDEEFAVQPMRRSLSMGSSSDRQMYIAVQEILRRNPHFQEVGSGEGTSHGGGGGGGSERSRRPFFSFGGGHCRNTRGAELFHYSKMTSHM